MERIKLLAKYIILMRHAKPDDDFIQGISDGPAITPEGREKAISTARRMPVDPQGTLHILTSYPARGQETGAAIETELTTRTKTRRSASRRLLEAGAEHADMLNYLPTMDYTTVVLVTHEPWRDFLLEVAEAWAGRRPSPTAMDGIRFDYADAIVFNCSTGVISQV
ncbi:MAG: hypothetical protein KBD15_01435 [Candidatus Magasanikbacteria bacterium]|nr:hypothetical protein [Candidatus Magasanikbacteria bacterium]